MTKDGETIAEALRRYGVSPDIVRRARDTLRFDLKEVDLDVHTATDSAWKAHKVKYGGKAAYTDPGHALEQFLQLPVKASQERRRVPPSPLPKAGLK